MAGANVRVSINHAALSKTTGDTAAKVLREAAFKTKVRVMREAPVGRTGRLARSAKVTTVKRGPRVSHIEVTVSARGSNGKDYAPFVLHGTGIHGPRHARIKARGKPFRWEVAGSRFRRAGVNASQAVRRRGTGNFAYAWSTQGQRPNNFLRRALESVAGSDRRIRILK